MTDDMRERLEGELRKAMQTRDVAFATWHQSIGRVAMLEELLRDLCAPVAELRPSDPEATDSA